MAYDSDIVGWITKGGKRIPIKRGNSGKDKPEWQKYDEKRENENVRKGKNFSAEVKAEAKNKADEYNKIIGKGKLKSLNNLARRSQYYAKKNNVDDMDFADYISGVAARRKNTVHKAPKTRRERAKAEARKYQASGQLSKDLQESIKNLDDKWAKHTKKR